MRSINRKALCNFLEEIKDQIINFDHASEDGNKSDKSTSSIKKPSKADSKSLGFLKGKSFFNPVEKVFTSLNKKQPENPEKCVSDEELEQNFKELLKTKRHGRFLTPDIVAHFDYFMNTLTLNQEGRNDNPFENTTTY